MNYKFSKSQLNVGVTDFSSKKIELSEMNSKKTQELNKLIAKLLFK